MSRSKKYDWAEIQKEYDSGLSQRDLREKYGIAMASFAKAAKRGDIIFRTKTEAGKLLKPISHSERTKKKISLIRKKFLFKNPDKIPYRLNFKNGIRKQSYPEALFEAALKQNNITGGISEYPIGIYNYDFAFPELKIDVEIDGALHLTEKIIARDAERDKWSQKQGWTVIRFTAKQVLKDVYSCIEILKKLPQY